MHNTVSLKLPAKEHYFEIASDTLESIAKDIHFSHQARETLREALHELFDNAVRHAYPSQEGPVEIVYHPFSYGLRIDVHDWGVPMAQHKYNTVPIDLKEDKGFNRIYKLVDRFEYQNLGKNGKKFSIIKYLPHQLSIQNDTKSPSVSQRKPKETPIVVRRFQDGDEEAIAKLIYQNYGYSYIKESFYYPRKIKEYQGDKLYSIVALDATNDQIVGHFALLKMPDSNIAEIGVVVVDPAYKGLGIMNKMFDALIQTAQEAGLYAIFGEAIMYHIFSQKSNLTHGFSESALLLGKAPQDLTIENNQLTQTKRRGSVLVGYKLFHYRPQKLSVPKVYETIIQKTYRLANLPLERWLEEPIPKKHMHLEYSYDPLANVATIVIDHYGKHFKHKLGLLISQLRAKHCDMIYAEICLEKMPKIDKIVKFLNKNGFFYGGILFMKHKNRDYLCLQSKHTVFLGKKNLVCYSPFCHELLDFIRNDDRRIKKNKIK